MPRPELRQCGTGSSSKLAQAASHHAGAAHQHVGRDREDHAGERDVERAALVGEMPRERGAGEAADHAAGEEDRGEMANRPIRRGRSSPPWSAERRVTATSDEPIALRIGMPVASISPGTIRKPPPMPKKPDRGRSRNPSTSSFGRFSRFSWTPSSPALARRRSMQAPTTNMSTANIASNCWPSTTLLKVEPPKGAGDAGGREHHGAAPFHRAARACWTRLAAALAPTAIALVPIATCASGTPTR